MRAWSFRFRSPLHVFARICRNFRSRFFRVPLSVEMVKFANKSPGHRAALLLALFFGHRNPFVFRSVPESLTFAIGTDFSNHLRATRNTFSGTSESFVPAGFACGTEYSIA